MAIEKPRTTKKRTYDAANASSSVAMVEMPPHGPAGADHIQPPPPLPPGVYFSPTREECLGFLNRSIAGDEEMDDARGYIFGANVYGEGPDALCQRHPPASIRGRGEHAWWFLSQTRFQSQVLGGGASKRAARRVETGGCWRLEQGKEKLEKGKEPMEQGKEEEDEELEAAEGVKNSFGFYVGNRKKEDKTQWLMQEFTSANDDGTGKRGVPALYRVYVTPRATEKQLRDVFGEDGVKKGPDGKKKPALAMVPQEYFDGIANLLPEGSVRGVVQEHVQAPQPLPPVAPLGFLDYHGQQGQYHYQYEQQQGQYLDRSQQQQRHGQYEQQYLGQYEQQQGQYPDHHQHQYLCEHFDGIANLLPERSVHGVVQEHIQAPQPPPPVAPVGLLDHHGQQRQHLGQYEQQQGQYLGQYEQQQGTFSVVAPPAASPGLLGEFTAEAPSDNLSMPMDEFMRMINEQPPEIVNEQPANIVKKEEEQNWEYLPDIVDADEFANFSK